MFLFYEKKMLEYMSVVRGGLAVQTSGGAIPGRGGGFLRGGWYPSAHYGKIYALVMIVNVAFI